MFKTTSTCKDYTLTTSSGSWYPSEPKPEAFITLNKNRQKLYRIGGYGNKNTTQSEASIYLPNQSQFEIELFNPTQDKVMAVVTFNGKYSNKGVILKPGERFFLDRHLDEQKKLLFDVYEVNGNNESVQKAIEKNGLIKIEFYKERSEPLYYSRGLWDNSDIQLYNCTLKHSSSTPLLNDCTYTTSGDAVYNSNTLCSNTASNNNAFLTKSSCNYSATPSLNINATLDFAPEEKSRSFSKSLRRKEVLSKSEETGRVDKGEMSEQKFKNVDFKAEYSPYMIFEYKLLPLSQKPLTSKEINENKRYCTQCGNKVSKKDKYCSKCGIKL